MNNLDSVNAFVLRHAVQLSARRALDYRVLPPGTYSHRTGLFPSCREGITDGVHALLWTGERVIEVAHSNLLVDLDPVEQPAASDTSVKVVSPTYAYRIARTALADTRYVAQRGKPRREKQTRHERSVRPSTPRLSAATLTDMLLAL